MSYQRKHKSVSYAKWGYIFLLPFFVVYVVFSLYPLFLTFYNSFMNYVNDTATISMTQTVTVTYNGVENYVRAFTESNGNEVPLLRAFKNTFAMWLLGFVPQIVISLFLASWFTDLRLKIRFQGFFKSVIYLPNVIMASAFAMLFAGFFEQYGTIYYIILDWTHKPVEVLNSPAGSWGVTALINFLMWYGNTTILLMAAIMGVDTSLYESAQIDGANSRQTFWKITIPLIRPIMLFVLITSLIGGLQMYDVPAILSKNNGNPMNSMKTLMMEISARRDGDIGLASAMCVIVFLASALLSVIVFFLTGTREHKVKEKKRGAGI